MLSVLLLYGHLVSALSPFIFGLDRFFFFRFYLFFVCFSPSGEALMRSTGWSWSALVYDTCLRMYGICFWLRLRTVFTFDNRVPPLFYFELLGIVFFSHLYSFHSFFFRAAELVVLCKSFYRFFFFLPPPSLPSREALAVNTFRVLFFFFFRAAWNYFCSHLYTKYSFHPFKCSSCCWLVLVWKPKQRTRFLVLFFRLLVFFRFFFVVPESREALNWFCDRHGFVGWFETSAKLNINIEEASHFLVEKVLEKLPASGMPTSRLGLKVRVRPFINLFMHQPVFFYLSVFCFLRLSIHPSTFFFNCHTCVCVCFLLWRVDTKVPGAFLGGRI